MVLSSVTGNGGAIRYAQGTSSGNMRKQCGFTLLELLVVMVIIGLLSAYVGPKLFAQIGKSETKVAKAQVESIVKGLDQYRIDNGHYPSAEQGLAALMAAPAGEARWAGPYMAKKLPLDPWGRAYLYRIPGESAEFDVYSLGRDGHAGGEGDDADVGSW